MRDYTGTVTMSLDQFEAMKEEIASERKLKARLAEALVAIYKTTVDKALSDLDRMEAQQAQLALSKEFGLGKY